MLNHTLNNSHKSIVFVKSSGPPFIIFSSKNKEISSCDCLYFFVLTLTDSGSFIPFLLISL